MEFRRNRGGVVKKKLQRPLERRTANRPRSLTPDRPDNRTKFSRDAERNRRSASEVYSVERSEGPPHELEQAPVGICGEFRYNVANSFYEDIAVDRETFDSTLQFYRNRTPFQPFTLVMVSGDRLEVDHGMALGVREGVALYVAPGGVPVAFDHEGVSHIIGDLAPKLSSDS